MTVTKLVEFKNNNGDVLRGIFVGGGTGRVVLMCGGFERSATTEKKFKALADDLAKEGIASLRFDFTGCGLSDGDFSQVTVKRMSDDANRAIYFLKSEFGAAKISIIGHSLSGCVAADLSQKINFDKIILIGPALNQKDLLRFWSIISAMIKQNQAIEVNWQNYKNYLDEKNFQADCAKTDRMSKANYISSEYFIENKDKDYSDLLRSVENILLIHGDKDDKVPLESLNAEFVNKIIVSGGDHDLERPDMFAQWESKAIDFLS